MLVGCDAWMGSGKGFEGSSYHLVVRCKVGVMMWELTDLGGKGVCVDVLGKVDFGGVVAN